MRCARCEGSRKEAQCDGNLKWLILLIVLGQQLSGFLTLVEQLYHASQTEKIRGVHGNGGTAR